MPQEASPEIVVVGPGTRFLGGLSVYTCQWANALAAAGSKVSVMLLDRLIPRRLYPGADRVGHDLTGVSYDEAVGQVGGIDWYWGPRSFATLVRFVRHRPDVLVLQWWTAATLHTYLVLAMVARLLKVRVVVEFHEVQDTGEAAVAGVAQYARLGMPLLMRLSHGAIIHNEHDRELLRAQFGSGLDRLTVQTAPHGPLEHLGGSSLDEEPGHRDDDEVRFLCFGLIRPYKGYEDAVAAFDRLGDIEGSKLSVVGETWEGHTEVAEAIAASERRADIEFVNRYVSDDEAAGFFERADAVVLPYRRGSASGPLHIAMSRGLWVIMYAVGGLVEAVSDYEGVRLVEPGNVEALQLAMREVAARPCERFADPHSWDAVREAIHVIAGVHTA